MKRGICPSCGKPVGAEHLHVIVSDSATGEQRMYHSTGDCAAEAVAATVRPSLWDTQRAFDVQALETMHERLRKEMSVKKRRGVKKRRESR